MCLGESVQTANDDQSTHFEERHVILSCVLFATVTEVWVLKV